MQGGRDFSRSLFFARCKLSMTKKKRVRSVKADILLSVFGALLTALGVLAMSDGWKGLAKSLGCGDSLVSAAKSFDKALGAWAYVPLILIGITMIAAVLDGISPKKHGGSALNSMLVRRPMHKVFFVFLVPMFASFCIGFLYPFFKGIFLSFCKFKTTSNATWVGLDNYTKALSDASFRHAFWYTALFAVTSVVLINVIAFFVAYILTQGIKGSNLFRTVFFMPNLIGGIVLGYIWSMIFDGILSRYNTSILMETKYGFWGLIILMCWQQVGYMMIIYIAGLQAIPEELNEAAKIDGASRSQTLWHVTIPNVMPSVTICTFLSLTNGFKLFDQNLALNGGQPFLFNADGTVVKTTEMLALNIYNTFYGQNSNSRGTAQAKAVLFFILVAALGLIQMKSTRDKEVQQ